MRGLYYWQAGERRAGGTPRLEHNQTEYRVTQKRSDFRRIILSSFMFRQKNNR